MKWTYCRKTTESACGYYTVGHTELAFNVLRRYIPQNWNEPFSYNWVDIIMFGLKPSDFFRYVQDKYHAMISVSGNIKGLIFFNKQYAEEYAQELDRRFQLCADEGYFGEYYDQQ